MRAIAMAAVSWSKAIASGALPDDGSAFLDRRVEMQRGMRTNRDTHPTARHRGDAQNANAIAGDKERLKLHHAELLRRNRVRMRIDNVKVN